MKIIFGAGIAIMSILFVMLPSTTSSMQEEFPAVQTLSLDDKSMTLEKKVISMNIPSDNKLPWGFVEGKIANAVPGYPVVIQIYKNGDPVHFAQTDVKEDGSYEYKFRVRNVDGDQVINIFQGDYTVKIFRTVYTTTQSTI